MYCEITGNPGDTARAAITAALTAGVMDKIGGTEWMQEIKPDSLNAPLADRFTYNLINAAGRNLTTAALTGENLEDALQQALLEGVVDTGQSIAASKIKRLENQYLIHKLAHATAGCAAAEAAGNACRDGAMGAAIGEITAQMIPEGTHADSVVALSKLAAGFASAYSGGDAQAAVNTAEVAVRYNELYKKMSDEERNRYYLKIQQCDTPSCAAEVMKHFNLVSTVDEAQLLLGSMGSIQNPEAELRDDLLNTIRDTQLYQQGFWSPAVQTFVGIGDELLFSFDNFVLSPLEWTADAAVSIASSPTYVYSAVAENGVDGALDQLGDTVADTPEYVLNAWTGTIDAARAGLQSTYATNNEATGRFVFNAAILAAPTAQYNLGRHTPSQEFTIYGFQGSGNLRGLMKNEFQEPYYVTGHVGFSIDDGQNIYGFAPFAPEMSGTEVIRSMSRDKSLTYPGMLAEDINVFNDVAANPALAQGSGVWQQTTLISPAHKAFIQAELQRMDTYRRIDDLYYSFYQRNDCTFNCAVFPTYFGVAVPESTGAMSQYIPVLVEQGELWKKGD